MKKLLLLLTICLGFISCDTSHSPISDNDDYYDDQLTRLETIGDTAIVYQEGNYLFYMQDGLKHKAVITSGTDYIYMTFGIFILVIILIFLLGALFNVLTS